MTRYPCEKWLTWYFHVSAQPANPCTNTIAFSARSGHRCTTLSFKSGIPRIGTFTRYRLKSSWMSLRLSPRNFLFTKHPPVALARLVQSEVPRSTSRVPRNTTLKYIPPALILFRFFRRRPLHTNIHRGLRNFGHHTIKADLRQITCE